MSTCYSIAFAEDGGFYMAVRGGGGWVVADESVSNNSTTSSTESDWDDGAWSLGAAVGYNWMDQLPIRTELEYMYHAGFKYDYADANATLQDEITIHTLMVNVFWDIYNESAFTPYLTAGVGAAFIEEDLDSSIDDVSDKSSTNVAFNVGGGVGWEFTEDWTLDLMYRYKYFGDGDKVTLTSAGNSIEYEAKDLSMHEVTLGVRYQF